MNKIFENNPLINKLTEKAAVNDFIKPEYYEKYKVKRGLRNENGTGVLVGLTSVGSVVGYLIENGQKYPAERELYYKDINLKALT